MSATAGTAGVVLAERQDGVLTMTINRPAQMNAVNHEVAEQLAAALDTLDEDPGLSVGVITGAGGTFCAVMDLKAFVRGELPVLPGRGFGGETRAAIKKPLVAAVEGWALGGGFELALACDVIVAAEDARFGFPEVTRGIVPSEGGLIRLPATSLTTSRPGCCSRASRCEPPPPTSTGSSATWPRPARPWTRPQRWRGASHRTPRSRWRRPKRCCAPARASTTRQPSPARTT